MLHFWVYFPNLGAESNLTIKPGLMSILWASHTLVYLIMMKPPQPAGNTKFNLGSVR